MKANLVINLTKDDVDTINEFTRWNDISDIDVSMFINEFGSGGTVHLHDLPVLKFELEKTEFETIYKI